MQKQSQGPAEAGAPDRSRRRLVSATAGVAGLGGVASLGGLASLGSLALVPGAARADDWPSRAVRVIVPYPPGGATDIVGRIVAEKLAPALGQPFVVENKGGAGGILGTDMTAKAAPDGYTITVSLSTSLLINQFLYTKLSYDPQRDLRMVSLLANAPVTLVTRPSLGVKTAPELLAYIRANKGKVSYGSWGAGSFAHLAGAYMSKVLDGDMQHIPYKGEAAMLQDLVGGQIDMAFASAAGTRPFIEAGKLTVLGVTGNTRMQVLPEVPTLAEQGVKDDAYRIVGFVGMAVPIKTPEAIVERLARETTRAFEEPAVRQRIIDMGFMPVAGTPAQFKASYEADAPVWAALVKESGARLD